MRELTRLRRLGQKIAAIATIVQGAGAQFRATRSAKLLVNGKDGSMIGTNWRAAFGRGREGSLEPRRARGHGHGKRPRHLKFSISARMRLTITV